ncbi:MAG: hypothetical protein KBC38_03815 [Candidatus Pacebacteria bacterium]|nr:hypothetical protein [Candidatus Paceibacterota bacterium]MBP9840554.1 hypothetical protein [Candidatus Paceibacterota bacterium]
MTALHHEVCRRQVLRLQRGGITARFSGCGAKPKKKTAPAFDHTLMIVAAARGIRKDVVAFCTNNDRLFGRVVEITRLGVKLEGHEQRFNPRFLDVATD